MKSVRGELDRMRLEAWTELYADVHRTGAHLRGLGLRYATRHPALLLGAGTLLGVLFMHRFSSPKEPAVERKPRGPRRLFGSTIGILARAWLMDALSDGVEEEPAAAGENGER